MKFSKELFGKSLFAIGTVIASVSGAHNPPYWNILTIGCILAVIGTILVRWSLSAKNKTASSNSASIDLARHLETITQKIEHFVADAQQQISLEKMKKSIESLQLEEILPVTEKIDEMSLRLGIKNYAEVFSVYAQGERNLNRAWSCCADNHYEEMKLSLENALMYFCTAKTEYGKIQQAKV